MLLVNLLFCIRPQETKGQPLEQGQALGAGWGEGFGVGEGRVGMGFGVEWRDYLCLLSFCCLAE